MYDYWGASKRVWGGVGGVYGGHGGDCLILLQGNLLWGAELTVQPTLRTHYHTCTEAVLPRAAPS